MRSVSKCWPLAAGMLVSLALAAHAERLRSPWDGLNISSTDAPYKCPAPPTFAETLDIQGYYIDKQASIIDPKKQAAFNAASEGPTHLGQYTTNAADAWLSKGSGAAGACVYSLLDAAAQAYAWTGKMPQITGVYIQNWMLSGTAIAYLKVRNSHMGTPDQDAEIQKWFWLVAARVREYFDMQRNKPGSDAYNNHMYWAGLAVAAQGIADDDTNAFIWGIATYRMGVDAIHPDGSLTAEMNRAGMAEHYQLYALGPLVMLAELAAANGLNLYAEDNGAIHRLVKFSVAGREDPSIIEKRTDVPQNLTAQIGGFEIGWAVPYAQRFPSPELSGYLAKAVWMNFWQWGGAPPQVVLPMPQPSASLQRSVQKVFDAQFPSDMSQPRAFLGVWCGDGDPTNHATITDSGTYLTLDNGLGDTSVGRPMGSRSIVAPGWQSVTGTLSPDSSQIDWTNGTYWLRCGARGQTGMHQPVNLTGTWYADGIRSQPCSIRQGGNNLNLDNGQGRSATGQIDASGNLTTYWNGNRIEGAVTADGNHINWDNQTYWTRSTVYESKSN
jgi:poly(beta-D-mannuronate) lyase